MSSMIARDCLHEKLHDMQMSVSSDAVVQSNSPSRHNGQIGMSSYMSMFSDMGSLFFVNERVRPEGGRYG